MKMRSIVAVALLAVPIILVLIYHLCDHSLPGGDGADFAEASLRISNQLREGPGTSIGALLNTRGWKPTIFSALAAPFFLLTNNDLVAGPAATLILIYLAITIYLYRLVSLWSADPLVAAATCAAVLSMQTIVTYALLFFSESAWILFSIACVYHLLRSGPFAGTTHAAIAGAFAGLMLAARPVESVIVLGILLSFMMARAIRSKMLALRGSLIIVAVFSVPAAVLLVSTWVVGISRLYIWGVCLATILFTVFPAKRWGRPVVAFFAALTSVACVWWGGFMPMLHTWAQLAWEDSVRARITSMRTLAETSQALSKQAKDYGELQLLVLFCLAFFLIVSDVTRMRRKKSESGFSGVIPESAKPVLYAVPILLVVFAAGYTGGGSDRRRGLVAFVLFAAPVIALAANRSTIALAGVLALTTVQCTVLASDIARISAPGWTLRSVNTAGLPGVVDIDQNLDVAQLLTRYVTTGSNVAVYTMALFGGPRVYEPNSMRIICLRWNLGFSANNIDSRGTYDEVVGRMRDQNWKYVLLDSLQDFVPTAVNEPHVHFTRELQQRLRAGVTPGLKVIDRFRMGGREHTIFRVLPEAAPPGSMNNLASYWYGSRAIATGQEDRWCVANLNDGTDLPWGSRNEPRDVYAGIVLPAPHAVHEIRLQLFTPDGRPHMRDIRIVAADAEGTYEPDWKFLRARLKGSTAFGRVVTVPPLPDRSVVTIEIDPTDPEWHPRRLWGFACLRTQGDVPNYVGGYAVYLRELEMQ